MIKRMGKLKCIIIFVLLMIVSMVLLGINSTSTDELLTTEFEVAEEISLIGSALVYNMNYNQLGLIVNSMIKSRKDIVSVTIIDDVSQGVIFSYSLNGDIKTFNGFSTGYLRGYSSPIVHEGQLIGSVNVELKPIALTSSSNYHHKTGFIIVFFLLVMMFLNLVFYALLKLSMSGSRPVPFGSKKFVYLVLSCMSGFILMTVVGGYFIIEKNRKIIEERVEIYLQETITDFGRDMERTRRTLESIYNQMTHSDEFQRVYRDLVYASYSDENVLYESNYNELLNIITRYNDFGISGDSSFLIMNVEGDVIAQQGNDLTVDDIDKTINSAFIGALSGNAEFLPPKKTVNESPPLYYADLYFSYPIWDEFGNVIGVFFSAIPKISFVYYDISQYSFGLSGELVAKNNDDYIVSNCRFPKASTLDCGYMYSNLSHDRHIPEHKGHLELVEDYRGEESYIVSNWRDDFNITLISKIDSEEVLNSFYEFQRGVILILVVMSSFTIFTTMYTLFLGKEANDKLIKSNYSIIKRLGHAAEFKDNETAMHIVRMSYYAKIIATNHGCDKDWVELLFNAAPMHDIGKIGVPDYILQKPGKLTPDEWTIMRQHPEFGARIIGTQDNELLRMAHDIAIAHHEKWDGTGYPYGIKKEEIPISARIIAIADVFDALTSERIYKKAWTFEDAVMLISSESGKHFEPSLVSTFMRSLPEISDIKTQYIDKHEENIHEC
ncbi:HD domain-containing phosphohydrolase [Moritella sp. 24]|uniref:HD domain-containing phosphohydrolase n=1 Tax=Moritella sp. 24 TaxID=2746230 RepID=UPI002102DC40|nr:HD domain-containing phosphohydrolase [Moritella sp. 24]